MSKKLLLGLALVAVASLGVGAVVKNNNTYPSTDKIQVVPPKGGPVRDPTPEELKAIHKYLDGLKKKNQEVQSIQDARKVYASVVQIRAADGSYGSGSIISSDGTILTAAHVAKLFEHEKAFVTTGDGKQFTAHVISVNNTSDSALMKVDQKVSDLPAITVQKTNLVAGERLTILGYGGNGQLRQKPVEFIKYQESYGWYGKDDMLMSPGIRSGDSGGPIVNSHNEQVGIGVAVDIRTQQSIGVSTGICKSII